MEKYAIDYIEIHKSVSIVNFRYDDREAVLNCISDLSVESCVGSARINNMTAILLPQKNNETEDMLTLLDEKLSHLKDVSVSNDLAFIEIGGHFVSGSNGLARMSLDILRKNKINIEYQLMHPSRYSFLISPTEVKKSVTNFIAHLGVRDSMVSIY